jgi:Fic family protein
MAWNWELDNWPSFEWDRGPLRPYEARFLMDGGAYSGTMKHLLSPEREGLLIDAISTEALTTSEIEGEILDRASVQSSIRKELGLTPTKRNVKPAERGVAEMMVNLYRTYAEPLSPEMLHGWHAMLFQGRQNLSDIGRYRTSKDAMEIISGPIHRRKIHFEAPPASRISKEMTRFIRWFNRSAPGGAEPLPALMRAGIAHLYFESIHPFEDGNGRIGRAISEKALSQALGQPTLIALAATILARRKAYYASLAAASKTLDANAWLKWFADTVLTAQKRAEAHVDFLIGKTRFIDRLRGQLNPRQEKALLRMLREGPDGFQGGLSAGNYATITGAPPATVTRDLADLVEKGALTRTGERRYARYFINIAPA